MLKESLSVHRGIWEKLRNTGYEVYFVGGCVRDAVLGRNYSDIDIATNAETSEIRQLFGNTRELGLKYGSIRVNYEDYYYDVTTFRKEGDYSDSRHPDEVEHGTSIEKDLERRDFTVNAMAFSFDTGLIDLFEGLNDIRDKKLRAVGNPNKRFEEDGLRMMRAVRFSCELGFEIESHTKRAITKNCSNIENISRERIYNELERSLKGLYAENIFYLRDTNLGRSIHPTFRLLRYKNIPVQNDYMIRLAYFMFKKEYAFELLKFLKVDNRTMNSVRNILQFSDSGNYTTEYHIRKLMSAIGIADAKRVLILKNSDLHLYSKILERGDCLFLRDLQIDGNDLIKAGIAEQGRQIRYILRSLLDDVLHTPEHNHYNYLIGKATEIA